MSPDCPPSAPVSPRTVPLVSTSSSGPLRRCALAVSVLREIDIEPADAGIRLSGPPSLLVPWAEIDEALDGADPESTVAHDRLARHLRARLLFAIDRTALAPRPYAVATDSPLHPGPSWVRATVLGGAMDVGLAVAGLDRDRPEELLPLPSPARAAARIDGRAWWTQAAGYLDAMATLAVARLRRRPDEPLRPMGDCDVVTLLASPAFRKALSSGPALGLRTAAMPMRNRGWLDLRRIDPAFAVAAANATHPQRRGFSRPVLVTADEVTLAPGGAPGQRLTLPSVAAVPVRESLG